MSDMISRSELLKQFPPNMENPLWHFTGIRAAIEAAPAIDAVPVVRCKDCKHMKERHYEGLGEPPYIKRTCGSKYGLSKPYTVEEWDFCSRGERKAGE